MIKRVFILEDNEHKLNDIVSCLKGHFKEDIRIDSCEYFNRGIKKLLKGTFDYTIIDNIVPRFPDSHELVIDAAEEALRYLSWEEDSTKCIVCSSDDISLTEEYDNCIGIIKYSFNSINWKKKLIELIK